MKVPSPASESWPSLTQEQQDLLTNKLRDCLCVKKHDERELILERLPSCVRGKIMNSSSELAFLTNLVRLCNEYECISEMLEAVRYFEGESRARTALDEWCQQLLTELGTPGQNHEQADLEDFFFETIPAGEYMELHERARSAVRRLSTISKQLGWRSIAAQGDILMEILKRDLYRVVITGRSRAGKSTLLNALITRRLCPTNSFLTTAVPIVIHPAEQERAVVTYQLQNATKELDGPITDEVLAPYADQSNNPGNEKKIARVDVFLSHNVLDLGVTYMDIPGFDDPSEDVWTATESVIGQAHALIFVLDVSPFSSGGFTLDRDTMRFLAQAKERKASVFIVGNKADQLKEEEKTELLKYMNGQLKRAELYDILPHEPFLMSAKAANDIDMLPMSYVEFRKTLWNHLWHAEEAGLRRLYRVFEQLCVASDKIRSLIGLRKAKAPDRDRLHKALTRCASQEKAVIESLRNSIKRVRQLAERQVAKERDKHSSYIINYLDKVCKQSPLPRKSRVLKSLEGGTRERFSSLAESIAAQVHEDIRLIDEDVRKILKELCDEVESSIGDDSSGIHPSPLTIESSLSIDGTDKIIRIVTAGGLSGLATGATIVLLGGPAGWAIALGTVVASAVSFFADHLSESAKSPKALRTAVTKQMHELFEKGARYLYSMIEREERRLIKAIQYRIETYREDVEDVLEELREPSDDELSLFVEMEHEARQARDSLSRVFEAR